MDIDWKTLLVGAVIGTVIPPIIRTFYHRFISSKGLEVSLKYLGVSTDDGFIAEIRLKNTTSAKNSVQSIVLVKKDGTVARENYFYGDALPPDSTWTVPALEAIKPGHIIMKGNDWLDTKKIYVVDIHGRKWAVKKQDLDTMCSTYTEVDQNKIKK